jgi:PilZ domain
MAHIAPDNKSPDGAGGRRPRHNGCVRDLEKPELREAIVERRLHTRHRARTTVYITVPGGCRKLCKAVNLSATGVFIETSNLGLRKGQTVVLSFAINLGTVTKLHRRTAVVAHVSRGGTGLMMESYSARAN